MRPRVVTITLTSVKTGVSRRLALLALIASGILIAGPAAAYAVPGPVAVTSLSQGGAGCPQGTAVGSTMSSDFSRLTFDFTTNTVRAGLGVPLSELRRVCQVTLMLSVADGWQYAVTSIEDRGYADLPLGAIGTLTDATYVVGRPISQATTLLVGPQQQNYVITQPLAPTLWSDCTSSGDLFNAKFTLLIAPTVLSAQLGNDTLTGTSQRTLNLVYRAC